jgi:hypothetical protein
MRNAKRIAMALAVAAALSGCATAPLAPRVAVMPGQSKPIDQFQAEDLACRRYAEQSVGTGEQQIQDQAAQTTMLSTLIGAIIGAAIGGQDGAAVGAGFGLMSGAAASSNQTYHFSHELQRRYDIAYQQCMYSRGNQVPGYSYAPPADARANYYQAAPAVTNSPPPPPPPTGNPPPPPPGVR